MLRLLGITVLVGVGLARRGPRERSAQGREGRRTLLVRGIGLGSDIGLHGPQPSQVHVEVGRLVAQLPRELAQFLGQARPRILRVLALRVEFVGELIESIGLAVGRIRDLAFWAMTRSCGFGITMTGTMRSAAIAIAMAGRWARRGLKRPAGAMRIEAQRVGALASHESIGLLGVRSVRGRLVGRRRVRRSGRRREGGRQFEGARDAVAEAGLAIDRQRRFADPGPGPDDGHEPRQDPDGRDDGRRDGSPGDRDEPGDRPEDEFRDEDGRQGEPRASHDATHPQPLAIRAQRRDHGRQGGIQRTFDDEAGIGRHHDGCLGLSGGSPGQAGRHPHQSASGLGTGDGPRRRRQRRVGETNWTDRSRKTSARNDHAMTVFSQMDSLVDPKAATRLRWQDVARDRPVDGDHDRPAFGRQDGSGDDVRGRDPGFGRTAAGVVVETEDRAGIRQHERDRNLQ